MARLSDVQPITQPSSIPQTGPLAIHVRPPRAWGTDCIPRTIPPEAHLQSFGTFHSAHGDSGFEYCMPRSTDRPSRGSLSRLAAESSLIGVPPTIVPSIQPAHLLSSNEQCLGHRWTRGGALSDLSDMGTDTAEDPLALETSVVESVPQTPSTISSTSCPCSDDVESMSEGEFSLVDSSVIGLTGGPEGPVEYRGLHLPDRTRSDHCTSKTTGDNDAQSSSGKAQSNGQSLQTLDLATTRGDGSNRKRTRTERVNDDDSGQEDEGGSPRSQKIGTNTEAIAREKFACPFSKHDPLRYSNQNLYEHEYRNCSTCGFDDISKLIKHLRQVHRLPENMCQGCCSVFNKGDALVQHQLQHACRYTPSKYDEKISKEKLKQIGRHNPGEPPRRAWYRIFDLLLPETSRPTSAYINTGDPEILPLLIKIFTIVGPQLWHNHAQQWQTHSDSGLLFSGCEHSVVDRALHIVNSHQNRQLVPPPMMANRQQPCLNFEQSPTQPHLGVVPSSGTWQQQVHVQPFMPMMTTPLVGQSWMNHLNTNGVAPLPSINQSMPAGFSLSSYTPAGSL